MKEKTSAPAPRKALCHPKSKIQNSKSLPPTSDLRQPAPSSPPGQSPESHYLRNNPRFLIFSNNFPCRPEARPLVSTCPPRRTWTLDPSHYAVGNDRKPLPPNRPKRPGRRRRMSRPTSRGRLKAAAVDTVRFLNSGCCAYQATTKLCTDSRFAMPRRGDLSNISGHDGLRIAAGYRHAWRRHLPLSCWMPACPTATYCVLMPCRCVAEDAVDESPDQAMAA